MRILKYLFPPALFLLALSLSRFDTPRIPVSPQEPEEIIPIEVAYEDAGVSKIDVEAPEIDENKTLGSYETKFRIKGEDNRAANISLAATRVITNLAAKGEFSFNDAVGPRTEENQFLMAPTIFEGEIHPGIGGGVCQVSSTIHAAALMSGLQVISRRPHSRVSKYISAGLDATVAYPAECIGNHRANTENKQNPDCYSVDLVIRNTYDYPIELRTEIIPKDDFGILRVKFIGEESKFKTRYSWYAITTNNFSREIEQNKLKPSGYKKQTQKGKAGMRVLSTLLYINDTTMKVKWQSNYLPVNEIWEVGSDWDMSGPAPWEIDE